MSLLHERYVSATGTESRDSAPRDERVYFIEQPPSPCRLFRHEFTVENDGALTFVLVGTCVGGVAAAVDYVLPLLFLVRDMLLETSPSRCSAVWQVRGFLLRNTSSPTGLTRPSRAIAGCLLPRCFEISVEISIMEIGWHQEPTRQYWALSSAR